MAPPATRFARNGDVRIAYQIVEQEGGDGPLDLVMVPGLVSHLDLVWEDPAHARFCRGLARFARLILSTNAAPGFPTAMSRRLVCTPGWTICAR